METNCIQLRKLKDLFSKLSNVADNIKALNKSVNGNLVHGPNVNKVRDAINGLPDYTCSSDSDYTGYSFATEQTTFENGFIDVYSFPGNDRNGSTPHRLNECCSNLNSSTAGDVRDANKCLPYVDGPIYMDDAVAMNGTNSQCGSIGTDDYSRNEMVRNAINCLPDYTCSSGSNYTDSLNEYSSSTAGEDSNKCLPYVNGSTDMDDSINGTNNQCDSIGTDAYSQFNERRLQSILNGRIAESNTTNYLYYLFDNSDVQRDANKCLPKGPYDVISNLNSDYTTTEKVVRGTCVYISKNRSSDINGTTEEDGLIDVDGFIDVDDSFGITPNRSDTASVSVGMFEHSMIDLSLSSTTAVKADMRDGSLDTPCDIKIAPHQGCDNSSMYVATSDGKVKTLCCMYCHKRYQKLARHLQTVHKNEPDVKKFRSLPPGSKERRKIIERIRNRGQFEWNTNKKLNRNELLTSRRPNIKYQRTGLYYLTCANCFGTFAKTVLTRHWNTCTKNLMIGGRFVMALGRAVEGRLHAVASDELRTEVFPKIREDVRIRNIRFDWLTITYGNNLCLNYSPYYQHGYIRKKLRDCAKLLFASKCISPDIEDFASLFHVKHCDTVIEAIRIVAKFDWKTKLFGSPGTASTIVTLVNTVGALLIIENIKLDDPDGERNVERFLKVFQMEVKTKINKLVAITQAKNRRNRKENIPTTEDIYTLSVYLDSQRDQCYGALIQKYSYQKWVQLSELTLASTLVFNRRRTGEMRNILVVNYHDREILAAQTDKELDVLTDETKLLIKSRMEIRGKLDRTVAALLKHDVDDCIATLLHHRTDAGITDTNEFLFALPSKIGVKTVDSCAVLRSFSVACGAKNPSSLRGTKLRKHMASFCATKDLSDQDVTNLAKYMGHDDKIHRDIYRHNTLEREVQQITLLLEAALGRPNNIKTLDTTATNGQAKLSKVKTIQSLIASDTSSDSCTDSYDDEPENHTKTRKRKFVRRKRQREVSTSSMLNNNHKVRKNAATLNSKKAKNVKKNAKRSASTLKNVRDPKKSK